MDAIIASIASSAIQIRVSSEAMQLGQCQSYLELHINEEL